MLANPTTVVRRAGTTTRHHATMPIIIEMIRSNPSVAFLTRVKRQKATIRLTLKIGNADTKIIMHLIPSEAKALQEAIQLTSVEMEAVSSLPRGQGLVCSASAKLFVDFVADDYEAKEITTDAKSFYERRKALEKKKREEEEKAAENTVIDVEM